MSLGDVVPVWRRASFFVLPAVFAVSVTALFSATAQAQKTDVSDGFASSADGVMSAEAMPAAPTPAGGGGQAHGSYGYHDDSWISHFTFVGGGGANGPVSNSSNDITWGWNFTAGGGYRFNQYVSALIEYQFIHDKLPGRLISETGADGGYAHIWSFTVDPVVDLFPKHFNSVYITGGGGFYRKVTNFTDPQLAEYCYYYYCSVGVENVVVGHFSSNQGGWSIGGGYSHRLGGRFNPDEKTRLFAEARYLNVLTPASAIAPNGLGVAAVSESTKLVPVTLGVRF